MFVMRLGPGILNNEIKELKCEKEIGLAIEDSGFIFFVLCTFNW